METEKTITLSDKEKSQEVQKEANFNSFFKDSGSMFIFKKAEKISTATYLITGLISEDEPLRKSIRQSAVTLLNYALSIKDISSNNKEGVIKKIQTTLFDLLSLFALAERSKQVSAMNHSVMEREILSLVDHVGSLNQHSAEPASISNEFFSVAVPTIAPQTLDISLLKESDKKVQFNIIKTDREISQNKKTRINPTSNISNESGGLSFKKDKRRSQILDIIKIKKQVGIKDISLMIKDCSEKTIQRELIVLVSEKVVKKEGERRWSVYSIV